MICNHALTAGIAAMAEANVIAVQETWAKSNKQIRKKFAKQGFRLISSKNRIIETGDGPQRGGGVAVYADHTVLLWDVQMRSMEVIEKMRSMDLTATGVRSGDCEFVIINCYAPQWADPPEFQVAMEFAREISMEHDVVLVGDFNAYHPCWAAEDHAGSDAKKIARGAQLIQAVSEGNLVPLNDQIPTTTNGTTIDLSFVGGNLYGLNAQTRVLSPSINCHYPVLTSFGCDRPNPPARYKNNYKNVNPRDMGAALDIVLERMGPTPEKMEDMLTMLLDGVMEVSQEHVPRSVIKPQNRAAAEKQPKWLDDATRATIANNNPDSKVIATEAANRSFRESVTGCHQDPSGLYEKIKFCNEEHEFPYIYNYDGNPYDLSRRLADEFGHDYTAFDTLRDDSIRVENEASLNWRLQQCWREMRKSASVVDEVPLKCSGEESRPCLDTEKETEFCANYEDDAEQTWKDVTQHQQDPKYVLITEILREVRNVDPKKRGGIDGIEAPQAKWLEYSRHGLEILRAMAEKILNGDGYIPKMWKKGIIKPLLKADKVSYRPLCLLTFFDKIIQGVFINRLTDEIGEKLSPSQSGFWQNLNGELNLVVLTDAVSRAERSGLLCIDFRTAFDVVSRHHLVEKMLRWEIDPRLIRYVRNYLSGRKVTVEIKNFFDTIRSPLVPNPSGIAQGSRIGPILFLVYVNDLIYELEKQDNLVMAFADDLNILVEGQDDGEIQNKANLALKTVLDWSKRNRMTVGLKKTKYLPFTVGKGNCRPVSKPVSTVQLKYGDELVQHCNNYKILGVIIDSQLNFKTHLDGLVKNMRSRIRALLCLTSQRWGPSCGSVKHLFEGYIYSLVRYAWPIVYFYAAVNGAASKLREVQKTVNECLRIITGLPMATSVDFLHWKCKIWDIDDLFVLTRVLLAERIQRLDYTTAYKKFREAQPNRKSIINSMKVQTEKIFPAKTYERIPFLQGKNHCRCYDSIEKLKFVPETLETDPEVELLRFGARFSGFVDGSVLESQNYVSLLNESGAAYVIIDEVDGTEKITQIGTGRIQHSYGSESIGLAALCIDMTQAVVDSDSVGCNVCLFTDCQSRIKSLEALKLQEVLDRDTLSAVNGLCKVAAVTLAHVRGHAGIHYNELCDKYAKLATKICRGEKLQYNYGAAKSRLKHVLAESRVERLRRAARADPQSRIGQAAIFSRNFKQNVSMNSDIPRKTAVIVNNIELNFCPLVYPEPPWEPTNRKRCQFCGGAGTASHLLHTCKALQYDRDQIFGPSPNMHDINKDFILIAQFVIAVSQKLANND